jgi:replicative DNA helicase
MVPTEERILPHSVEVERQVLCAMILSPKAIMQASSVISTPDVFYRDGHRKLYTAIVDAYDQRGAMDLVILDDELTRRGIYDDCGGVDYVSGLLQATGTTVNVEHHSARLVDYYVLRQGAQIGTRFVDECFQAADHPGSIISQHESDLAKLSDTSVSQQIVSTKDAVPSVMEEIRRLSTGDYIDGIPSGWVALDSLTYGFRGGELVLIAGRPGMGKSAALFNIVRHLGLVRRKPVLVFSLEMSVAAIIKRLVSSQAKVNLRQPGGHNDEEKQRLRASANSLEAADVYIDSTPGISPMEIRSKARRMKDRHGIEAVIVDYIQLMRLPHRVEKRHIEVGECSARLKELSKELDVPVIAGAQVNRDYDGRPPQLAALRESGSLEQDSDKVIMLHRKEFNPDDYDSPDSEQARNAERDSRDTTFHVRKHRDGPVGDVQMYYHPAYTRFFEYAGNGEIVGLEDDPPEPQHWQDGG